MTERSMTTDTSEPTVTVTIDGVEVAARPGELVIQAAERAGIFIPRFCYHPRMESVGVCRMCLVEISGPRGFSLQPSCFVRVADGQEVLTSSPKAKKAQEGVLEFLLVNHPLDCPVCDKGGECPLQDQAVSYGPGETRFIEPKRHWPKPIEIGPLVALDRERCIQCSRCTRFAAEVAGEALIDFAFRGSEIEVAPFPLEPFSSYFSGNTVQICPVGALTAQPYRFRSRPWDLEQAESTCEHCAVGCRIVSQSSAGALVRYLGVDVESVNWSWLCDKGRFGYESVNSKNRLRVPVISDGEARRESTWHEALGQVAERISRAIADKGPSSVAFIGGSRLTNEDAYAFAKLAKGVIGTDSVDAQLGDGIAADVLFGLPRATIGDMVAANAVLVLNVDLREELPVAYLRLREALSKGGPSLVELTTQRTALGSFGVSLQYVPGELARIVAAFVESDLRDSQGLAVDEIRGARARLEASGISERGDGLVVVVGRGDLGESAEAVAAAALQLAAAYPNARFLSGLRRANVHGALDMGLAPGVLPGRVGLDEGRGTFSESWGALPSARGLDCLGILRAAAEGTIEVLVTLGADLLRDVPDRNLVREALDRVPTLISLATHEDATTVRADVVLPVAGEAERNGTVTNIEGRVSVTAQKVVPPGVAWPAWTVAAELAHRLGSDLGFGDLSDVASEVRALARAYRGLDLDSVNEEARHEGVVVPVGRERIQIRSRRLDPIATPGIASVEEQGAPLRIGRVMEPSSPSETPAESEPGDASFRSREPIPVVSSPRPDAYSYRLSVRRSLYDQGTLVQAAESLGVLAPSPVLRVHPNELERLGVVDGGTLRLVSARASIELPVVGDRTLSRQVVAMAARSDANEDEGAFDLLDSGQLVTDVRLESV